MSEIEQCPCLRAREGCDFHDPKLQPGYVRAPVHDGGCDWAPDHKCGCVVCAIARSGTVVDPNWRLLGKDDPEVSADWIYAVPGGGLVGVPE